MKRLIRICATPVCVFIVALGVIGCQSSSTPDPELISKTAGELRSNRLYEAAIEEYRKIAEAGELPVGRRGSAAYLIARIYFDDLKDYENAAAWYVRARMFNPNADYDAEASRSLVTCLEKMGQFANASRQLRSLTDIDSEPADSNDVAVAVVGDRTIYRSEIEREIEQLSPEAQKELLTPGKFRDFVQQYAGYELLYRAAVREGFDRDPEILQARDRMLRNAVLNKFVTEKVLDGVTIDSTDVRNFYQANRAERYNNQPFDSVRSQVTFDYQSQKANSVLNDYIRKLAEAERFEIYEQNLR